MNGRIPMAGRERILTVGLGVGEKRGARTFVRSSARLGMTAPDAFNDSPDWQNRTCNLRPTRNADCHGLESQRRL